LRVAQLDLRHGAAQVELGLRRLFEPLEPGASLAKTLDIVLDPPQKLEVIEVRMSQTCPFHAPPRRRFAADGPASVTARELLDQAGLELTGTGALALVLDWPICTSALCHECGHRWSPMARLAALRQTGVCPHCGSRHIVEIETLRRIERNSKWARRSLRDLGIPERHLHMIERYQGV